MSGAFDDLIAANPKPSAAAPERRAGAFDDLLAANPKPAPVTDAPAAGQPGNEAAAVGRGIINGVPVVGPYLLGGVNRAVAGVRSLKNDTKFSDELKTVEQFGEATAKESPTATISGEVLGGVVGMAPAIAAAPAAFGAGAASLPVRTGASFFSGGVIGGADAAVRTDGSLPATRDAAILGAVVGGASPAVGNLVGRGVRAVGEAVAGRAAPVPGLNAQAAGKLADDLRNAGGPDAVRGRLTELGPDAMLLDASPSFEGRAQGLAVLPDTREAIMRPLAERARGANARLARDIDANIGPATNPAGFERTLEAEYERVVPPLYARAFAEPIEVDTRNVLGMIDSLAAREKGGAATGLARTRELLMMDGPVDAAGIPTRVPDPRPEALHNAKEALDAMIATVQAQPGGSARNSELRALTTARRSLNGTLETQVPGYGFANRSAEHFFRQREAFGRGQTLLNGGREAVRPGQLAEETAEMAPGVAQAQRDGLRAEVDRLVGTKANDRVALADAVKGEGDWNRARMNTVFGEEPTAGLVGAVERERAFDTSHQRINNNAMTELRKRAADDVAPRSLDPGSGEVGTVVAGATAGAPGIALAQGVKGLKATANAMGREADIARNRQIAEAVTMIPGEALDALITALGVRAQGSASAQNAGEAIELLTQALLQSQGDRSRRIVPSGLLGQKP